MAAWTELDDAALKKALVKRGVRSLVAEYLVADRHTEGARWRINATIRDAKAKAATA